MIDSTLVRAQDCPAGLDKSYKAMKALGRSKGGFATKIDPVINDLGNPLRFQLTPGQCQDIAKHSNMIKYFSKSNILADKSYDTNNLID